jgi:hypothetical protein
MMRDNNISSDQVMFIETSQPAKIEAPYKDYDDFLTATENLFLKYFAPQILPAETEADFKESSTTPTPPAKDEIDVSDISEDAWEQYQSTVKDSKDSSVLYKFKMIKEALTQLNQKYSEGRIYSPERHTWPTNLAWLAGKVHRCESFIVISEPSESNIYRQKSHTYSAFAKEITVAMKAQYQIILREKETDSHYFHLRPTLSKEDMVKYTIDELDPSIEDITREISKVQSVFYGVGKSSTALLRSSLLPALVATDKKEEDTAASQCSPQAKTEGTSDALAFTETTLTQSASVTSTPLFPTPQSNESEDVLSAPATQEKATFKRRKTNL